MRNRTKPNEFFSRFLRAYLIVLAVPMVFGMVVYRAAFVAVEEQAIDTHRAILRQTQAVIERSLLEVERLALEVADDPKVRRFAFVDAPYQGANAYKVVDTATTLSDSVFYDELILNYFVFYAENNMVIGPDFASRTRRFYPELFRYSDIPYTRWLREFVNENHLGTYVPARDAVVRGQDYRVVTYLRSFPIAGNAEGVVAVLLDDAELQALLSGIDLTFGGWVGVLNQSGVVLTGTERDGIPAQLDLNSERTEIRRIDGRSMLVTGVQSGRTGWTYAAVVPVEGVLQRVETIRRVVVGVVVLTVLVGLGVAAGMAHRHTKPVQLLLHDNRALHDELERQAPFLRAAFLERLFRGEFYSEEETRSVIDHVDVDLRGAGYTAILVEVGADLTSNDQLASVQRRRIIVRDALSHEGGSMKLVMHDMYDHRIAVIAVHSDEDPDIATGDVDRLLRRWSRVLQTNGLPDIRFGIGSFRRELTGVAASFEEARSALAYLQFLQSSTVAWFGDLSPSKRGYYYPQELETRLMNAVRAGDAGAVERLLSEIREKNINERTLSQEFVRLLAYDLWATVLKLLEERVVRDDELTEEARSSYTQLDPAEPHIALDACARALYKLCASVEARKKSHNTSVADRIKAFIERRYADPALSLTLLSEEFSVSEAYLSGLFKEQTGENLSTYLQSVRMHHAKRLLEGSYISVKEIGRRVGYPSYSTFARAFKRVFGVSASDYRSR